MFCRTIFLIDKKAKILEKLHIWKVVYFSAVAEVTCQDEDSNKYFEGVTWSVDDCTQCECNGGIINCRRELVLLTSPGGTVSHHCDQTQCNVSRYVQKNHGICKACRWKDKLYFDGDQWQENGVDFYCSSSDQRVRPGCYVQRDNVRCTGAIEGIRSLASISNESLWLCESGDEIRSFDDRCNIHRDCHDQSDERNCDRHYCASETKYGILWPRTLVDQEIFMDCSLVDSSWTGTLGNKCYGGMFSSGLILKTTCTCEERRIVEYFNRKITEANETNFMNVSLELLNSGNNFTNKRVYLNTVTDLFNNVTKRLFTPITHQNANLTLEFCELIIQIVLSDNAFYQGPNLFCVELLAHDRNDVAERVLAFLTLAPNDTRAYLIGSTSALYRATDLRTDSQVRPDFQPHPNRLRISRRQLILQINTNPLIPSVTPVESQPSPNIRNSSSGGNNGSSNMTENGRTEIADQQIKNALEANNCSLAYYDEEQGVLMFKDPSVTSDSWKQNEIQDKLELTLLCFSISAVFISIVVLCLVRIKNSERIFIHKNLLLSLGLGNLVYILDRTLFTNRKQHPAICSTLTVAQHFLHTALFTWMLVEGINLYIKLVRVFSVNRQYLTFSAIGWGIPAIIVALVAAIKPSTYDMGKIFYKDVMCGSLKLVAEIERSRCWINGSLWIYKGPVLAILLANMMIFVILLRVIFGKISAKYGKNQVTATRRGVRSIFALLPLLGVTWLLGFVIQYHDILVYLFILLNSSQGVVFCVFHCLLDDQVQESLRKLRAKKQVSSKTGDTRASNQNATPTMERNSRVMMLQHCENKNDFAGRKRSETRF